MANQQKPRLSAHPKENKPVFVVGMIRVVHEAGVLVEEDRPCFLKRDSMLICVRSALDFVPDEVYIPHRHNVYTGHGSVKTDSKWIVDLHIYRCMYADGLL